MSPPGGDERPSRAAGGVARLNKAKEEASTRWAAIRERIGPLDHAVQAWTEYKRHRGDLLAGAVTFFSFLSLFPLVLLAVSVTGFILQNSPNLQAKLFSAISDNLPGTFGDTLQTAVNTAISARASVGLIGLGTLLLTGLGWVRNLRAATEGVWGQEPVRRSLITSKLADLMVLTGLGLAALLSLTFTVVGSAASTHVLNWLGLGDVTGLGVLTRVVGIGLGAAGDVLIFGWLMVRLPRVHVPFRVVLGAAVLCAVGFEVLKLGGTYYIARVTQSPTAGVFGSVIGVLVWLNLVARYLLMCVAWAAVDPRSRGHALLGAPPRVAGAEAAAEGRSAVDRPGSGGAAPAEEPGHVSPAATAAVLVGTGAVAGAAATVAARRLRR